MKRLLLIAFLSAVTVTFAQTKQPLRVEIGLDEFDNNYAISVGNQGVFVLQEPNKADNEMKKWLLKKYDTNLKIALERNLNLPEDYEMVKSFYDSKLQSVYLLFAPCKSYSRTNYSYIFGNFSLIKFTVSDGRTQTINGSVEIPVHVTSLKAVDDMLYVGGYLVKSSGWIQTRLCLSSCACYLPMIFGVGIHNPMAVHITGNFKTKELKQVQHTEYLGVSRINDMSIHPNANTADLLAELSPQKKVYSFNILQYNSKGDQTSKIDMNFDATKAINYLRLSVLPNNDRVLFGAYSVKPRKYPIRGYIDMPLRGSDGFCVGKIENGKPKFVKFYDYSKFTQYSKVLAKCGVSTVIGSIQKIDLAEKRAMKGSTMLIHDILEQNGQYIMVAEVVRRENRIVMIQDDNGKTVSQQRLDGWVYTHAIVAGFSKTGDLIWDQCFETTSILSKELCEQIKVLPQANGELVLAYNFGGFLFSKVIRNGKEGINEYSEKIESNNSTDKIKENWGAGVDFWYDNFMIAYGSQNIQNSNASKGESKKRKVFYLNKISYK